MNLGCYDELGRSSELLLWGSQSVDGIICEKSTGKLYKASLINIKNTHKHYLTYVKSRAKLYKASTSLA